MRELTESENWVLQTCMDKLVSGTGSPAILVTAARQLNAVGRREDAITLKEEFARRGMPLNGMQLAAAEREAPPESGLGPCDWVRPGIP